MKNGWADFFTSNRNEHDLIKWNSLNEIYPKINGTSLPQEQEVKQTISKGYKYINLHNIIHNIWDIYKF